MITAIRCVAFGLLVTLAACAQGGGKSAPSSATPAATQQAGITYSLLASADQADAPGAVGTANRTFTPRPLHGGNLEGGDERPAATFKYYFVHAVQAAKPKRVVVAGNGAGIPTASHPTTPASARNCKR